VQFAHGAIVEADVVVAADGIHSELRRYVCPPSKPVFHGTMAYRGLVARERLPDWPMDRWQMWAGPARHFLVFPVRHATMVNYVGFVPTDEAMKESWSAPGDPAVLRREFDGWDPRIANVLQQVDTTLRWALYDREPLSTWSNGRLTLLGDAAHPMLPHLGQGANQAMEDGMALATILAGAHTSTIPASLLAYERLRRERVADIQRGARQNGLRLDSASADLTVRDAGARRARRVPQAPLCLRRRAGCARRRGDFAALDCRRLHDRIHLTNPAFLAISPTRLCSARISAAVFSGVS
jgi:salicylate hydroxylase